MPRTSYHQVIDITIGLIGEVLRQIYSDKVSLHMLIGYIAHPIWYSGRKEAYLNVGRNFFYLR